MPPGLMPDDGLLGSWSPRSEAPYQQPGIQVLGEGSSGGWLSGLLNMFGGGDLYGDMLTPQQKAALGMRSLGAMAGAFAQAGAPSRLPVSLGQAFGAAGQAAQASQDEGAKTAFGAMKILEDMKATRQKRQILAKAEPMVQALIAANIDPNSAIGRQILGAAGVPAGAVAGAPAAPASPSVLPGAPGQDSFSLPEVGTRTLDMPPAYGARPAAADQWGAPASPGVQFSGLLTPPPGPLDQVVGPDGLPLQGSGLLANASYTGGTPGGMPPFERASASTATPGAAGDDWEAVKPLIRKYESGNRNIEQGVVGPEGGYNPSVGRVTGPSSASGYYQMIDPTWRHAARMSGIDTDKYPRAINAPEELQDKAAEALYREQGLRPWAPYNKALAQATGYPGGDADYVIPSGRGIPASAVRRVADTGTPGAIPGAAGYIPGLGITPQGLGALDALLKMGGMDSPFSSVLESYYKSPGYLAEAERARATAQAGVELSTGPQIQEAKDRARFRVEAELKPALEAAVADAMNGPLEKRKEAEAAIDRVTKQLEQAGAAGTNIQEATIQGDDGKPVTKKMSALEIAVRERQIAKRREAGDMTVRPGDIVGTPVLSPEDKAAQEARGRIGQEITDVQVWTPAGTVTQRMTNQEAEARRALASKRGGGAPQIGDIVDKPVMTPSDQKVADALGEDFIALRRQATAASKTIRDTHNLRQKLDSGMFTGLDANINLFLARFSDTLPGPKNLSDAEKIKNTETYIAGLGSEVLAMVKDLRPASNTDLAFAERMAGSQNLSAASIRQLLDMREEYARLSIERHNEEAASRNPEIFKGTRRELPMPPVYQPMEITTPSGNRAKIKY